MAADTERLEARIAVLEATVQLLLSQTTPQATQLGELLGFLEKLPVDGGPSEVQRAARALIDAAAQLRQRPRGEIPWPVTAASNWQAPVAPRGWFGPRNTIPVPRK